MRYPLPRDTADTRLDRNHNLGLALDRYLQVNDATDGQNAWKIADDYKQRKRIPQLTHSSKLITAANGRVTAWLNELQSSGSAIASFSAKTDYRLVVGFGAEHVLETSICLHRIYGFPIIPGSAVKGVTRVRAFWDIAEQLKLQIASSEDAKQFEKDKQKTPLRMLDELLSTGKEEEQKKLLAKLQVEFSDEVKQLVSDFYQTFGTTERQGKVTFFEAYPTRVPQLETDILNPHYGPYYSDKSHQTPPADYHNPIPTFFLTVAKGAEFRFAVASENQVLTDRAADWLSRAFQDLGIGGKTAAGYGFMRVGGV